MNKKQNFYFTFFSIITIGVFPLVIYFKTPKIKNKKHSINIEQLILDLGKANNISGIEYTKNKIKVHLKNHQKINLEKIKENHHEIQLIFFNKDYLSFISKKNAKQIAKDIEIFLRKKEKEAIKPLK